MHTVRLHRDDEQGFTSLEIVVALFVLLIFMSGLGASIYAALGLSRDNQHRLVAANLASQEMDRIRSVDFASLTIGSTAIFEQVDGVTYTVERETSWVASGATGSQCDSGSASPSYMRASVYVTWPNMGAVAPVESSTILTPPVGAYDPNLSHIAVKVLDRNAGPEDDVPVTITRVGFTDTQQTTSDGCAFFGYVSPATYAITVQKPGYVDRQGEPGATQVVVSVAGNISSAQFDYDASASILPSLVAANGGTVPSDIPITLGQTYLLPNGTRAYSMLPIPGLFPYAEGFELWAGGCADADPIYFGAGRAAPTPVTPGENSAVTVALATRQIRVESGSGIVSGASIVLAHDPDPMCNTGESYTVGTTDSGGNITVALPYGTWTVSVVGYSGSASFTLSPLDLEIGQTEVSVL